MGADALNLFNSLEADFKAAFADGNIEIENVQKTAALTVLARVDLSTSAAIGRPNFHFLGGAAAPNVAVRRVRPRGCAKLHERGPDAPLNRPRTPAEAAAIGEATSAAVATAIASAVDAAVSTAYANAAAAVPPAAVAAAVPEE